MFLHLHSASHVHRSVIDMCVYTFYLLCDLHTNSPRLATCRAHSIISGARADLTWRLWVRVYRGQNISFLPRVVQISYSWANANWVYGLNLPEVGRLLVPSVPVKLSHMDLLKSETTFNWTCIISLYQHFIPKKRQRCIR